MQTETSPSNVSTSKFQAALADKKAGAPKPPASPDNAVEKLIGKLSDAISQEVHESSPGSPSIADRVAAMRALLVHERDEVRAKVLAFAKRVAALEDYAEAETKEEVHEMVAWVGAQEDAVEAAVVALAKAIAKAEDYAEDSAKANIKALAAWIARTEDRAEAGLKRFRNRLVDATKEEYAEFLEGLDALEDKMHSAVKWAKAEAAEEAKELHEGAERLEAAVGKVVSRARKAARDAGVEVLEELDGAEDAVYAFGLRVRAYMTSRATPPAKPVPSPDVDLHAIADAVRARYAKVKAWFVEELNTPEAHTPVSPPTPVPVIDVITMPVTADSLELDVRLPPGPCRYSYAQRFWRMAHCYGREPVRVFSSGEAGHDTYITSGPKCTYNWMKFPIKSATAFASPCFYDSFNITFVSRKPTVPVMKASTGIVLPVYQSVSVPFRVCHNWSCNPVVVLFNEDEVMHSAGKAKVEKAADQSQVTVTVTFEDYTYTIDVNLVTGFDEYVAGVRRQESAKRSAQVKGVVEQLQKELSTDLSAGSQASPAVATVGEPNEVVVVRVIGVTSTKEVPRG